MRSERGVTLVALVAMVVIIFTILSVVLYNGRASARLEKLNDMYSDISTLEEKIQLSYIKNENLPISENNIELKIDDINPNDAIDEYYSIDESVIKNIELNNNLEEYCVNKATLTVYYKKGYEYKNIIYHTIPREYAKLDTIEYNIKEYSLLMKKDEKDEGTVNKYTGRYKIESISSYYNEELGTWLYFNGWKGDDNSYYRYAYKNKPEVVTAEWIKYKEKIKVAFYDGNIQVEEKEYIVGEKYGELLNITYNGKVLLGWKNELGETITEDMIVTTHDDKLYAVWENDNIIEDNNNTQNNNDGKIHSLIFDPLAGIVSIKSKNVKNGDIYGVLPQAIPHDNKFEFEGWYIDKEFNNKINENDIVNLSSDIVAYAKYIQTKYIVIFKYNTPDGAKEFQTKTIKSGDTYGILPILESITYNGKRYHFVGWFTDSRYGYGEQIHDTDIAEMNSNITLYAHWIEKEE